MAGADDCPPFNPRPETPEIDPALGPVCDPGGSLVESLGKTVDDLRQIATDLGLRPYRVFSVLVRWTGGGVGRGEAVVVREQEFLPTPKLVDMAPVRGEVRTGGLVERGTVRLRQISPRYTEDEVRTLTHVGPLGPGEQGWVEVRVDDRDGSTRRRRFVVVGVPFRDAGAFEWRADLLRQDVDRDRAGRVHDVG